MTTTTITSATVKYEPRIFLFTDKDKETGRLLEIPTQVCEHIIELAYTMIDKKVLVEGRTEQFNTCNDVLMTCYQCKYKQRAIPYRQLMAKLLFETLRAEEECIQDEQQRRRRQEQEQEQ